LLCLSWLYHQRLVSLLVHPLKTYPIVTVIAIRKFEFNVDRIEILKITQ
jgi:hypothetical protein